MVAEKPGYVAGIVGAGGTSTAKAGAWAGPRAGPPPSLDLFSLPAASPPNQRRRRGEWSLSPHTHFTDGVN